MRRRRVKLGLYGQTVAEIIPFCKNIIAKMTGNVHFPNPNPTLAVVDAAVEELYEAYQAASDGGKTLKATVRSKLRVVYNKMRPLRDYVNEQGDGDEEILNTSGFPLAELPTPIGDLQIPGNVRVKTLEGTGKVEVVCDKVKGATGYQIRYRLLPVTDTTEWITKDPMGPKRQTVKNLASAVYHEFQMRAIGSGEPSSWSGGVQGLPA